MVTTNIDVADRLVNGTLGTVRKLDRVANDPYGYPVGRIYIQCDDPTAGNKLRQSITPRISRICAHRSSCCIF